MITAFFFLPWSHEHQISKTEGMQRALLPPRPKAKIAVAACFWSKASQGTMPKASDSKLIYPSPPGALGTRAFTERPPITLQSPTLSRTFGLA